MQPFRRNRQGPKIGERGSVPLSWEGAESPSNTNSPGLRPMTVPSAILIHPAVWPQTWVENLGRSSHFLETGERGSHLTQSRLSRGLSPYQVASESIQPFGHNGHWPKIEPAPPPFREGVAGSPSNTMSRKLRPTSIPSGILIHAALWPQQIWAENWRGLCPSWSGGAGSPSNTMCPGPRPTCMPSFVLIHPTIWPQFTDVTDRQDRTDNGPVV